MSRRDGRRSRRGSPQARGGQAAAAPPFASGGTTPRLRPAASVKARTKSNSCCAHSVLPAASTFGDLRLTELHERLDVKGGVLQPGFGQRPGRPVDRRVLPGQPLSPAPSPPGGRPTAGSRQPSRSSVSNIQRRRRPISARQGRSWVAGAGPTRCLSSAHLRARRDRRIGRSARSRRLRAGPGPGRRRWCSGSPRPAWREYATGRTRPTPPRTPPAARTRSGRRGAVRARERERTGGGLCRPVRSGALAGVSGGHVVSGGVLGRGRRSGRTWGVVPGPRWPRRLGMAVTPSGTGGRPAAVRGSSPRPPRARRCRGARPCCPRSATHGVHQRPRLDLGAAALHRRPSRRSCRWTRVTVPEAARSDAPWRPGLGKPDHPTRPAAGRWIS